MFNVNISTKKGWYPWVQIHKIKFNDVENAVSNLFRKNIISLLSLYLSLAPFRTCCMLYFFLIILRKNLLSNFCLNGEQQRRRRRHRNIQLNPKKDEWTLDWTTKEKCLAPHVDSGVEITVIQSVSRESVFC
jgi:hypothetical protein